MIGWLQRLFQPQTECIDSPDAEPSKVRYGDFALAEPCSNCGSTGWRRYSFYYDRVEWVASGRFPLIGHDVCETCGGREFDPPVVMRWVAAVRGEEVEWHKEISS